MINDALVFLKNHLNQALQADSAHPEKVVFVSTDSQDPVVFQMDAVSLMVVGIEEEKTLRAADPYRRSSDDGTPLRVRPDIRLNLHVLFVARSTDYEDALKHLSHIIRHFQKHYVFDHHTAPELGGSIEKLIMELITLPLSEQNDLWNALRTTYQPSVLYKVRMVVFSDADAVVGPTIEETALTTLEFKT